MKSKDINILVVDDEALIRWSISKELKREGYNIFIGSNGKEALMILEEESIDILLLDIRMPEMNGFEVLDNIKNKGYDTHVIIISALTNIGSAVEAVKKGAFDYVTKPFDIDNLKLRIEKTIENRYLVKEVEKLREEKRGSYSPDNIIGEAPKFKEMIELIKKISPNDTANVLLLGESGTGKDLIARAIHNLSPRTAKSFVGVNCSSFPETLIESELFGYEKGSFTGANSRKKGLIDAAEGGTLFLDEIGDMPIALQAKLLHILEHKVFRRIGGTKEIKANVRIIAATNRDLNQDVKDGRFREDLYFRIAVIPIKLTPLRERKEDIPLLVEHFIKIYNNEFKRNILNIDEDVIDAFIHYNWPGNIRELKNVLERAVILAPGNTINLSLIPKDIIKNRKDYDEINRFELPEKGLELEKLEEKLIKEAMRKTGNNITEASKLLGLSRDTMRYRLKKINFQN